MNRRVLVLRVAVLAIFALLAARLWQVQVIHGRDYRRASEENRIRLIRREGPRGAILDRQGRVLATSRVCLDIVVTPEELAGYPQAAAQLASVLGEAPGAISAALRGGVGPLRGLTLAADVSLETATRAAEASLHIPGMRLQGRPVRHYPRGAFAAHALGYVRDIDADELERLRDEGYTMLDRVGKRGVEWTQEKALRGLHGGEQVEVDARGKLVRVLGEVAPVAGQPVVLCLDARVQAVAEEQLAQARGAAVVMDARNGEVLAMASAPDFDPNVFGGKLSRAQWAYLNGPGRPQQNRAAAALYEPGSVFKIITAAAAIEEGQVHAGSRFSCPGYYALGDWRFNCWERAGHGSLDFVSGIAHSCNVMFIRLGRAVGRGDLERWARAFGLGGETGIDLPEESEGLVPNPRWKRRRFHEGWYPGDTCQMSVGQGGLLITPLQAAVVTAAIANSGYRVTPHLVRSVGEQRIEAAAPRPVGISPRTAGLIREGMAAVVRRGTARRIWDPDLPIAGKTGTAENPHGRPHAWFVGFAPVDRPRVVVAVVIEQGGRGSGAAPAGAALLRAALTPAHASSQSVASAR